MSPFWEDLLTAFALLLILEGFLPTVAPRAWMRAMLDAARLGPRGIRAVGIVCMISGALMLHWFL
ncbi:MAG: DUF2065 domain-containing protein [Gammaproteobacteria bacterium]